QTKPVKAESYQVASAGAKPIVKAADRYEVASATSKPVRVAQAGIGGVTVIQSDASASGDVSANDVINSRGYWRGLPDAADAPPLAAPEPTVAVKRTDERPSATPLKASIVRVGDRFDDPWMHAMIVSPSAQNFLKTTVLGPQDFRELLGPHLLKPAATMVMSF